MTVISKQLCEPETTPIKEEKSAPSTVLKDAGATRAKGIATLSSSIQLMILCAGLSMAAVTWLYVYLFPYDNDTYKSIYATPAFLKNGKSGTSMTTRPIRSAAPNVSEKGVQFLTVETARSVTQGSGETMTDRSVNSQPIRIGGMRYKHGLGTHAKGRMVFDLTGKHKWFKASVGIDDEVILSNCGPGSKTAAFIVKVDGVERFRSPIMEAGQSAFDIEVPLGDGKKLALITSDGGDNTVCDHADWANARLTL